MVVAVESLIGFDVYRDGGSLSASFRDVDGIERTLFFPVHLDVRSSEKIKRLGYKPPLLQHFDRQDYSSRVTGETIKGWQMQEQPISWEEAVHILDQMRPLVPSLKTDYPHVFAAMVEVARADGQLTQD